MEPNKALCIEHGFWCLWWLIMNTEILMCIYFSHSCGSGKGCSVLWFLMLGCIHIYPFSWFGLTSSFATCQCNHFASYTWSVSCPTWKWLFILEDRCSIHPQENIVSQHKRPQSEVKHLFTVAVPDIVILKVGRCFCYQSHSFYVLPIQSSWYKEWVLTWTINGDNFISSEKVVCVNNLLLHLGCNVGNERDKKGVS